MPSQYSYFQPKSGKKDKSNTKSKSTDIDWPTEVDGRPDFGAMTPDQRLAYHTRRLSL